MKINASAYELVDLEWIEIGYIKDGLALLLGEYEEREYPNSVEHIKRMINTIEEKIK